MTEYEYFPAFVTKGIEVEKGDRRIFKGHITAEIIDKQQEFIFVKEVMEIMDEFMKFNKTLSDSHTNRMVGQVLGYEKSEINGVASVLVTAEIYKSEKFKLYDKIWEKIVKGEYAGLSMGGASKEREPMQKDGKMALELRKLELYEIAVCEEPANPFAIIEKVNTFAKANHVGQERIQDLDGRCILKCDQIGMCFEKGTNVDEDVDLDNKQEEHGLEQFDKPEEVEKDHIPSVSEEDEEEAKKKNKEIGKKHYETITGESASQRADDIGQATYSPKQQRDTLREIKPSHKPKIEAPTIKPTKVIKQSVPEDPPVKDEDIKNSYKKMTLLGMINHFGEDQVRKALESLDTLRYLRDLSRKYD